MRIKWLALAAILAETVPILAETIPFSGEGGTEEDRQCIASTDAMCEHVEGHGASSHNTYIIVGGTCYAMCVGTCNGEGSELMTTVCGVQYLNYWFIFFLLIFLCTLCRLVWKVLSCIFCCGTKGSDMH